MANYVMDEIWKPKQQQHENAVKKEKKRKHSERTQLAGSM